MRKSFVVFALLVGAAAMLTTSALAFEEGDQGLKYSNAKIAQRHLSSAARLRTSADSDTFFVGHMATGSPTADNPWVIGQSPYRPGPSWNGTWDFDSYNGGLLDSLQGWFPTVRPNARTAGSIDDTERPWFCLDWGNRLNATYVQGRTVGIIGLWHSDPGVNLPANGQVAGASPTWTPLAGTASAWCGLRAGKDVAVLDDVSRGGTGNPINGDCLWGEYAPYASAVPTSKLFPGYANRWDQMLYRDVRVATGASLTVSFQYRTAMSINLETVASVAAGWFNVDPLSMTEGAVLYAPTNFVSSSNTGEVHPIDSFMVYVGVPTDPTAVQYSDLLDPRPMYDMKRRWFSEVLKIDKPYIQILSTYGNQQATYTGTLSSAQLAPLLEGQAVDGGVVRVVFRSKTNKNFSDESGTNGSYNSATAGAVMIDGVSITGCAVPVSSGFETAAEINNTIEGSDTDAPGPDVGEGYALDYWHSTGKPPKHYVHTHPLFGGDIAGDGSNVYAPLAWADICGPPDSPLRFCNVAVSVVSTGDHDNNEAAGGGAGTPFLENVNGMVSPAINLVTPLTGVNNMGIDRVHAMTNASWWIRLDNYWGIFDINTDGNVIGFWLYNYPSLQDNGAVVWSDAIPPEFVSFNPDRQCYWFDEDLTPLIRTSNPGGKPDSIRLAINREQRCITWKVTDGCSPTGGHYIDNVTFVLPPPTEGAADKIAVGIWDWYNDAFPANETTGLPGIPAAFDTCGAHIFTGYNIAPMTGDLDRFIIPGDSLYFTATNATGEPMRLDIVFRILPGPGNYVTLGNKASGLRRVPTSTTPAVAGDGSFWGQYLADPGPFAKGNHVGGWNVHTWNSVRVDTTERNFFPVDGKGGNLSFLSAAQYQTTMHEQEPKLATLGILKNRCFMIDTAGVLEHTNITCSTVPTWLTTLPQNYTGYDGQQQTREFTKIWPDGLFTAGTHVEYFIRLAKIGSEAVFVMNPDTNVITPQMYEGPSWDGHRWQEFSILPDRWKDALYGGIGGACMLVVDNNDRRGDEIVFVSMADSIGLTKAAKYGAHNGWHCTAAYSAPSDGSDNFYGETGCGDDPTIAVWSHGGSPGTLWDMYQIKASESSTTGSAALGDRLANRSSMGLLAGKEGRHGPTPEMLRAYYKMIFWFSGDLNMSIMGPEINMGQDDVALLKDFLGYNASVGSPRGFYGIGDGFVEALDLGGADPRTSLVTDYFAAQLRDISYYNLQGMVPVTWNELIPTSVITTGGEVYGLMNGCLYTNDVLDVNRGVSGAVASSYYEPLGANAPYVSGVYAPSTTKHPYMTMVDGWDMWNMYNLGVSSTMGRLEYYMKVLGNTFYSVCPFVPELTVDVPFNTARNVNFLDDVAGNPLVRGMATVRFSLAKADRVEIKVYDVTGRLVKSLADKTFDEGPQTVTWDGTNDQGRTVSRGVYFTQVKYVNSGFVDAKKVTVLK